MQLAPTTCGTSSSATRRVPSSTSGTHTSTSTRGVSRTLQTAMLASAVQSVYAHMRPVALHQTRFAEGCCAGSHGMRAMRSAGMASASGAASSSSWRSASRSAILQKREPAVQLKPVHAHHQPPPNAAVRYGGRTAARMSGSASRDVLVMCDAVGRLHPDVAGLLWGGAADLRRRGHGWLHKVCIGSTLLARWGTSSAWRCPAIAEATAQHCMETQACSHAGICTRWQ
jgi:hypothetical protein